mmetsp:Transcript_1865/g.2990  ORF Transcript_1865/g.2990 Transcript_1865/m.2990 type:complete len:374 (+) Transcript_1865:402-1523(+)
MVREGYPPSTRFGYVSAVWRDSFVVFGGYDGSTWLNDLHEFNFLTEKWIRVETAGHPPSVRSCPSWVSYKKSLFIFGGYDGVHRMNDFHEYNFETKTWSSVVFSGPAPSPRYFHSSVTYGDSMYLFGGYSGSERLHDLYQFSFEKKTWTRLDVDKAPSGRSSLVCQVYKNSMFIFGGYNGSCVLNDFYEFRFELIAIPQSSLISDLRKMINNPLLSDVTFVVEGREVLANKAILAARSEHFRALFYGGMRETHERRVHIPDMPYAVFTAVMEYLYTDNITDMSGDMSVSLMIAAEQFMLERLKALCQDKIRKIISEDNVVPILRAAYHHGAQSLQEICMDYICAKWEDVKRSPYFGELVNEPKLLMDLVLRIK